MGYDASKGEYVDMIKAGIVDPLKVVRTARGCVGCVKLVDDERGVWLRRRRSPRTHGRVLNTSLAPCAVIACIFHDDHPHCSHSYIT